VNNPELILRTLDRHLKQPVELTLYGRAAFALGFAEREPHHEATQDVDAIIPLHQIEVLRADEQFWDARDATNRELEPLGLYITHLFGEDQIFLRPGWLHRRIPLPVKFEFLQLLGPARIDLILTKMLRDDAQDLDVRHEPADRDELLAAFQRVRLPELDEFRCIFDRAKPKVLALLEGKPVQP
jgi:hypothetical protein